MGRMGKKSESLLYQFMILPRELASEPMRGKIESFLPLARRD
jgi:hypothetical protein